MVKKQEELVRVKIAFSGFIAPINAYGPCKPYISKEQCCELIRCGFGIELMYPSQTPEFAEELKKYYDLIQQKKVADAAKIAQEIRYTDNAVEKAMRDAQLKEEELRNKNNGAGPIQTPEQGNKIEMALAQSDAAAQLLNSEQTQNDQQRTQEMQEQLDSIVTDPNNPIEGENGILHPQGE